MNTEEVSFQDACTPWFIPEEGVITTDPPNLCDNSFLFTSTYFFISQYLLNTSTNIDFVRGSKYKEAINKKEIRPGLFNAFQSWSDPTLSHDEILGLAIASSVIAEQMHSYGVKHGWVFNNLGGIKRILSAWIGRFPLLVCFIRDRANITQYNPLIVLWSILEFLLADINNHIIDTSGRCRRFIMATWFADNSKGLLKWAAKVYLRRLQKQYGSVGGLYRIYFHGMPPFYQYTKNIKFIEDWK